ncbi:hypothetical protein BBO99_00006343 [Phytophthora kernoviae]|uniref:F-actin-capping protein subunit beta n=1 Tax=Phytophthora kernoviae TaxID=325452 RepID=A0A421ESA8_9STRA|nr:hypothetical protein JM16_004258 [Phytophthora kernoviae]RLM95387.1 hypothetical protein BBI17_006500 [Phytophthora kernoviae]RLN77943.1 hypothetical protein BBO99_00006343 [Phytophthora kernoviae]
MTEANADASMTSCLNLMRRMPPREVETDVYNLTRLIPNLADDLYQRVDQPLQAAVDPANGRKYLLCDYNRDGDSYRSPWTNQYDPPVNESEGFFPSETLRELEIQANEIFDSYRELYYQGGISSVYMWDLESGFAACFLVKKDVLDQRFVEKGSWNSIHVIEVQEGSDVVDKGVKKAMYRLTTSVLLDMKVNRPELGDLTMDGTLTRQTERTMEFEDQFAHVSNMGRMVEDMEIEMRSSLDGLYISKTREVINGMRKLQQGPAVANPFVGELAGAVLKHGLKKADLEKFFTDQSHMGSVYQTLAYLLEAREYMETSTGSGVAVVSGNTDALLLWNRHLLRRWCRFLEIVPASNEPDVYALREEVEEAGESMPRTQVQYEFSPPDSDGNGVFQLLQVQHLGDDG